MKQSQTRIEYRSFEPIRVMLYVLDFIKVLIALDLLNGSSRSENNEAIPKFSYSLRRIFHVIFDGCIGAKGESTHSELEEHLQNAL